MKIVRTMNQSRNDVGEGQQRGFAELITPLNRCWSRLKSLQLPLKLSNHKSKESYGRAYNARAPSIPVHFPTVYILELPIFISTAQCLTPSLRHPMPP